MWPSSSDDNGIQHISSYWDALKWYFKLSFLVSFRHALPLFTSLINVVCAYDPVGYGMPYNHLLFHDSREPLVEVASQILVVTLDHTQSNPNASNSIDGIELQDSGEVSIKKVRKSLCVISLDTIWMFAMYNIAQNCKLFNVLFFQPKT